jgi:hypothetical protein
VVLAASVAVCCDPLVARDPVHPPDAEQAVALLEDQWSSLVPPVATVVGFAVMATRGPGGATVTVTDCDAEPPGPSQVKVNCVVALKSTVACDPLVGSLPLHPPDAVQVVEFDAAHVKVDVLPSSTVVGLADSVIAGAGPVTETVADCIAVPPGPSQVSVYVASASSVPVDADPLTALLPDHEPEAVQAVAFVVVQVNVELPPCVTLLGCALTLMVGCGAVTVTVAD